MQKFSLRRALARHLLIYAFDMAIAIAGWTYGFGLHVRSWWALVLLLIVSRFFTCILSMAWIRRDALDSIGMSTEDALYTRIVQRLARDCLDQSKAAVRVEDVGPWQREG